MRLFIVGDRKGNISLAISQPSPAGPSVTTKLGKNTNLITVKDPVRAAH
jgi:hypothetical protein